MTVPSLPDLKKASDIAKSLIGQLDTHGPFLIGLALKRMSISQTASDLTGKSQSAGVERQPGVEHLRCKARKPLVPPTTSIWRPEITFLQIVQ
jgi:hypothetical protein